MSRSLCPAASVAIGSQLYHERMDIFAKESERLATQARVVGENVAEQLDVTSHTLAGVRDDLALLPTTSEWRSVSHHLKALADAIVGVRTMTVLDAQGKERCVNR